MAPSRYMARSTTMSSLDVIDADTSPLAASSAIPFDPDRVPAARRHIVVADRWAVGRRPQVAHRHRGGAAAGVLQQVEEVERSAGRALGEVPLPAGGAGDRPFPRGCRSPSHVITRLAPTATSAVDLDAELGAADAEVRGRQRAAGARGDRQRQAADGAVGEQRRDEHVRVDRSRVAERQLPGEERVRGALGEPAREAAARMRAGEELGAVADAVAVGIVGRAVGRRRRLRIEAEGDLPGVGQAVPVRCRPPPAPASPALATVSRTTATKKRMSRRNEGRTPSCAIDTFCIWPALSRYDFLRPGCTQPSNVSDARPERSHA